MAIDPAQLFALFVILGAFFLCSLMGILWLRRTTKKKRKPGESLEYDIAMAIEARLTTPEGLERLRADWKKHSSEFKILYVVVFLLSMTLILWLYFRQVSIVIILLSFIIIALWMGFFR